MAARETFSYRGDNVPLFALNSTVEQIGFSLQQIAGSNQALGAILAEGKFQSQYAKSMVNISKDQKKSIQDMHYVGLGGLNRTFLLGTSTLATSLGAKLGELKNLSKGMDRLATLFKPTALGGASGLFNKLTAKLEGSTIPGLGFVATGLKIFGSTIKVASLGMVGVLNVMEGYRKNLLDLTNYGTGFGTAMTVLEGNLASAGMSIDEYILVMQEHGAGIRNLGTTAQEAGNKFAELARNVKDTAAEFGSFGLTTQEVNQFIGEYLDMERRRGVTGKDAANNVESAFRSLALQTDAMARQTGRERRDALRAGLEVAGSGGVRRRAEALGGDAGARLTKTSALFGAMIKQTFGEKGEHMLKPISDAIATGAGLELTELRPMIALMGESGVMLSQLTKDISEGKLTEAETGQRFEAFTKAFADLKKSRDQRTTEIQAQRGTPGMANLLEIQTSFIKLTDVVGKAQEYVIKTRDKDKDIFDATDKFASKQAKFLGSYEKQMDDLSGAVTAIKLKVIEPFINRVDDLAVVLSDLTKRARDEMTEGELADRTTVTDPTDDWLGQIFKSIEDIKVKVGLGADTIARESRVRNSLIDEYPSF
jgi:hypothetical protein